MHSPLFLKNKIARQININGCEYSFNVMCENEYHELEEFKVVKINGLYHEKNSYQTEVHSDSSITHSKPLPMLLCLLEDVSELAEGSTTIINDKTYKIVLISDIQKYGVAADISLEEVL